MARPLITFTAATPSEWGAAISNAREFIRAWRKLVGPGTTLDLQRGTLIHDMFDALSPREQALVRLGQLAGEPLDSFTIQCGKGVAA